VAIIMTPVSPPPVSLFSRLIEITRRIGLLGFIGFGGPQVNVVLFKKLFVCSSQPWLDPLTFADLFALSGSLPGPGSTQLLFSIALVRAGALAGLLAFFFWS
jgi:chromate transport protein ChrA